PERRLGPNRASYPGDGRWLALQVAAAAEPLWVREVLARRDAVNAKLDAIADDLERERRGAGRLRQDSRGQPALEPEQREEVKALGQGNRWIEAALEDVAGDAAAAPVLQAIAEAARAVAGREMRRAAAALRGAETAAQPQPRDAEFREADQELASA